MNSSYPKTISNHFIKGGGGYHNAFVIFQGFSFLPKLLSALSRPPERPKYVPLYFISGEYYFYENLVTFLLYFSFHVIFVR